MELLTDSPNVLSWILVGLVAAAGVAALCVVVCAVAVVVNRLRNFEHDAHGAAPATTAPADRPVQLPVGAEAALNAIVELRPDPRNVVVTHRDPTGEVRLWPADEVDHFQRSA